MWPLGRDDRYWKLAENEGFTTFHLKLYHLLNVRDHFTYYYVYSHYTRVDRWNTDLKVIIAKPILFL